ncbi:TonB family protein [Candidatus Palauibacter sp.]|uniref:TonB family protein n=1 Tax=Candidatus Palauibacter sp. TaxID=3101350 RepID=UPI003B0278F0
MISRPDRAPAGLCRISVRALVSMAALNVALAVPPPRVEAQATGSPAGEARAVERIAAGLTWRLIGPAISGGRIADLEVVPGTQSHIYVGAASGGVWKSVNHGTTWTPIFDDAANLSVGDIALAPSDPLEVWVGTGEPNNRNSSPWGEGVYHSSDGGKAWRLTGLEETRHIGRIVVHPEDPDIVWVAALGHLFGPNPERGVYRTTDRGATWEKVLHIDDDTGFVDLALNPGDPSMVYAAAYQRRRRAWGFAGGGPGSGIYKSTDGGDSWREVTEGLPDGNKGRIGLAVSGRDPALVMAVVEAEEGGIFLSRDRGETWARVNELNQRPMYYSQLRIDPNDEDRVWLVAGSLHRSEDGGENFEALPMEIEYNTGVHVDHHDLWIDPRDSRHMILGNDGGLYSTWDGGDHWTFIGNIPIAQFYDIDLDLADPYHVYGGLQDNNSYRGPSRTRRYQGIMNRDWQVLDYGDGMYAETDWSDLGTVYVTSQNAGIVRVNLATGDRKALKPFPPDTTVSYRFDWKSPILVSPHDAARVYLGGNRLFLSLDRGESWLATDDLTRQIHQDSLELMGMRPDSTTLSKHDGASGYGEITAVAESPVEQGVLWIGADDGSVRVSRDGGGTWEDLTDRVAAAAGLPFPYYVSWVETSHAAAGRAYVSLDGHWDDDYRPLAVVTDDYGDTWRSLAEGLSGAAALTATGRPTGGGMASVNVIREHPDNPDLLLVGAENGAFASLDRGTTWAALGAGLPAVPVDDIEIHPRDNDVVLGTHGRAIWILDDISPLSQGSAEAEANGGPQLFAPRPATLFLYRNDVPSMGQGSFRAENPAFGANIDYRLPMETQGMVTIDVLDHVGQDIRRLEGSGAAGLNRITWDLRHDPLSQDTTRYEVPSLDAGPEGPFVLPGMFTVRLTAGAETREQPLEVRPDPEMPATAAERRARYEFTMALFELQRVAYQEGSDAYDVERRASEALEALEGAEDVAAEDLQRARELVAEIEGIADEWRSINSDIRNWWTGLRGKFDGGPSTTGSLTGPSDDQQRRLEQIRAKVEAVAARRRAAEDAFDVLLELAGLPPREVRTETMPVLSNVDEVRRLLVRFYPEDLKSAGIGGRVQVWFRVNESGVVGRRKLRRSSGYDALDAAALAVARGMRFDPATHDGERSAVWVSQWITFEVR